MSDQIFTFISEGTLQPRLATVNNIQYGCRYRMEETQDIVIGVRVSKRLHARIVAEQQRIAKSNGIKPSLNEVARLLFERGLEANGRRKNG